MAADERRMTMQLEQTPRAARSRRGVRSPLAHDAQLVKFARGVARLEARRKRIRKQLRKLDDDIRFAKRELQTYAEHVTEREHAVRTGTAERNDS